jgi:transcriptional regulator with XRE-family HTH domain
MEREARKMSYEGLASRMGEAGCPIQASAIYKIEKSGRRITVDELLGFAAVFGLTVPDLLRPREVAISARLSRLFDKWEEARQESLRAQQRTDDAFQTMAAFVQENHKDALRPFFEMVGQWAESAGDSPSEVDAVRAMVLASAVPVGPFQQMEKDALEALAAERGKGG